MRPPTPIRVMVGMLALFLMSVATSLAQQLQPAPARTPWTIPSNDEIRKLLAERMAHNGVGIVVGVIEPAGRRLVVYGKSGAPDGRPLDGDTVFQIGSVTKVFTGLLLADMVQRGEVKVDDPASKYLPFGVRMPERGRPITLIDLSKHWSALPSMPTNFSLDARPNPYEAYSVEQLYQFLSRYELPREPGKQAYSNLGVALLGHLLARHAGMEYEALLKQRVLAPLGLKSTAITLSVDHLRRLAPGHDRFLKPVETWNLLAMPASGSLRSTANDLLTFLAFNLGEQDSPLNAAMVYQRTPGRALGWGASRLGGEAVYGHEGGKEGYRSAVVFNPRTKTGVVVLTNARTDDRPMDIARHLLFGESPLSPAPAAPSQPKTVPLDAKGLDAYSGRYRLEPTGLRTVARRNGYLLVDTNGDGISTFFPSSDDEFFSNTEDVKIVFERDGSGRIKGLMMRTGGTQQSAFRIEGGFPRKPTKDTRKIPKARRNKILRAQRRKVSRLGLPKIPTLREVGSRGFFVLDGPFAEFDPTHPAVEIWTPDGDANAPVMVYAHGGAGYREDDRARVAMFRRNGFATISFDSYVMNGFDDWNFVTRSVANSGKQNMIWGVFKGAVDYAATNGDWDNRNIFLYGGSNGGRVVLYAGSKIENENIRGIIAEAPAGSGFALGDYTIPTIIPFGALDTWAGTSDTDYVWKRTYPDAPISIEGWVNAQQAKGRPVNFIFYKNAGHLLFEGPLELVTERRGDAIAFTAYRGAAEGVLEQYEKDVMSFVTGKLVTVKR